MLSFLGPDLLGAGVKQWCADNQPTPVIWM